MGSVIGIQNKRTHLVFRFLKIKFFIYNSYKTEGRLEFTKKHFGIFGFYFFINLKKFSETIIINGEPLYQTLEDWVDYRIVRRKEICGCGINFKKYPKGPCPCENPNELIEIRNEGVHLSNRG